MSLISIPNRTVYFNENNVQEPPNIQESNRCIEDGYWPGMFLGVSEDALYKTATLKDDCFTQTAEELKSGLEFSTSSLSCWKDNGYRFPALAEMTRKYLDVNATSVSSGRLSSKCKRITNAINTDFLPENVKMNVLMHC